jgi:hypothetical protein
MEPTQNELSRRSFFKTAAYVAPVILTLKARPAHASIGSGQFGGKKLRSEVERFVNDVRKSEHSQISAEDRSRMQRQAQEWRASGTDRYIQRAVDHKIKDLKRSGNERAAIELKKEVAHLIELAKKLLRF